VERLSDRLLNWASILDDVTRRQAERTASLPFVYPHVALMPDAHLGKGATVGSVLPTKGAIIPAAVGVDIGCGMIAVRTPWSVDDVRARGPLAPLRGEIERAVPLSAGKYNKALTESARHRVRSWRRKPTSSASGFCTRSPRRRPTGRCSWAVSARATTSSR
jgi:tRNA-splicing ligase RtcB